MQSLRFRVSTWLNDKIRERNWSIRRFGREIGVSATHAARLVNGTVPPSVELCKRIARVFKMRVDDVVREVGLLPSEPMTKPVLVERIDTELILMRDDELIMWFDTLRGFNTQRGRHDVSSAPVVDRTRVPPDDTQTVAD